MKTIDDILKRYKRKTFKTTGEGLVAIKYKGLWLYFRWDGTKYGESGSTDKFQH